MPKICYVPRTFSPASEAVIEQATEIIDTYTAQGYSLTLRQLYYRFVAADLIPNTMQSYKRLGSIVNDARLAGLIDWHAIEDRTRNLRARPHWSSPEDIVRETADAFHRDLWEGQNTRVEVWVEKEALVDVIGQVAHRWDVPYFACRGYVSQSEMWVAAQRLKRYKKLGARGVVVLHLGDHDPSGIDMTRDMQDRLNLFGCGAKLARLALNMNQIEEYEPPPNPAKVTDSRFEGYVRIYGTESWELDALEPAVLDALIEAAITSVLNRPRYDAARARMERERQQIATVAARWAELAGDDDDDPEAEG